jgi:hypothetical protein
MVEGNSIRAIVRMTGASKNTIVKLLEDAGAAFSAYQDQAFRNLTCKRISSSHGFQVTLQTAGAGKYDPYTISFVRKIAAGLLARNPHPLRTAVIEQSPRTPIERARKSHGSARRQSS